VIVTASVGRDVKEPHPYEIVKLLGEGGMGTVFLARDLRLGRSVAIKFLQTNQPEESKRLLIEARTTARFQHDNIVVIHEIGEHNGVPYIVLEYLDGKPLTTLIENGQRLPYTRAVEIMCSILRALQCAHEANIAHRDLKPDNIFVMKSGSIKVLDFGIAKVLQQQSPEQQADKMSGPAHMSGPSSPHQVIDSASSSDPVTSGRASDGVIAGTLQYMSPEQWGIGVAIDHLTDIWACGLLLHEMICGRHPLQTNQLITTMTVDLPMPSMAKAAPPGVPRELIQVIDRCLFKIKAQRWQNAAELLTALGPFLPGHRTIEPDVPESSSTDLPPSPKEIDRSFGHKHRRDRKFVLIGGLVTAMVVMITLITWSSHLESLPPAPRPAEPALDLERNSDARHSKRALDSAPTVSGSCPAGMVHVPAGTFWMGNPARVGDPDEHPQHQVTLTGYCIDKTEVTVKEYGSCVRAKQCPAPALTVAWSGYPAEDVERLGRWCNSEHRPEHPMNCVDWTQAAAYCKWASKRLPTEAEWEFAARGNDGRAYPWGNEAPSAERLNACDTDCVTLGKRALNADWARIFNASDGWDTTAPVGTFPGGASSLGVLDMAGNVWEWTADWYGEYLQAEAKDPQGPKAGMERVIRGGGWNSSDAVWAHVANRGSHAPTDRTHNLGFRCARGD
jgi:formylglycine-generating enzyme required for sulfatase activity/predicted Ser/Thr protein kinase